MVFKYSNSKSEERVNRYNCLFSTYKNNNNNNNNNNNLATFLKSKL